MHVSTSLLAFLMAAILLSLSFAPDATGTHATPGETHLRQDYLRPDPCPTGNESTRTLVEIVLGGEGYADERAEIGMPTTDPSQIQMLQAPEDEAACQFLNEEVSVGPDGPKWLKAYYKAGDFYFIALRYQRETLIYFGYGYVLILNSDLEGLKVFAV